MASPQMQRPIPEVVQDIVGNFGEIIRSEFKLAKVEMQQNLATVSKPATTMGAGLALAFYGLGFLLLGTVFWLSTILPRWQASFLVGALTLLIGGILVAISKPKLKIPVPDKTIRSLEENVQWTKQQIK